ncbi:MAG: hypothetical protein JW969_08780 [Spirochaetales bacterium]|nr:hypothetical protein [Spirochaetales bacterium]
MKKLLNWKVIFIGICLIFLVAVNADARRRTTSTSTPTPATANTATPIAANTNTPAPTSANTATPVPTTAQSTPTPVPAATATPVSGGTEWVCGVYYAAGTVVTYLGNTYVALVSHTAYCGANWNPADTPTLWTLSSGGGGGTVATNTPTPSSPPANTSTPAQSTATPTRTPTPGSVPNTGLPKRIMVGYWHTWNSGNPFIPLAQVNSNWDVINIAFAVPASAGSTNGQMTFSIASGDASYGDAEFRADIRTMQSRGKKIVLSIGGYEGYFSLTSSSAVSTFVNGIKGFISSYGFNGIDIDLEQSSVQFNPGADPNFQSPTSPKVVNMISAISQIVNSYSSDFILSWAPETFYFQLGYQFYGGLNAAVDSRAGVWIPMIHALRSRTTYVHAQLYNSGAILGTDGVYYTMGNSAAVVAMCNMVITGFNVNQNSSYFFPGLRADQVVIGVPASASAAGSGQISNSALQSAFSTINNAHPGLRGIMAWSINWDSFQNNNSFVISNRAYLNTLP